MLQEKLKDYTIILASASPRRHQFFKELKIDFSVEVKKIKEIYPESLKGTEITEYLSKLKAAAFSDLSQKEILITSDTIVWKEGKALEKPQNYEDAFKMLQTLSNTSHEVITSVCFTSKNFQKVVTNTTKVWFKELSKDEINFYLSNYKPYDKAGSYGIQEWIGYIGIEKIEGSYFNVMGLPTHLVYKTLMDIANNI